MPACRGLRERERGLSGTAASTTTTRNDGDDGLYALHAARVTSRPAERRVGTRLAGRARREACLCLPASLPALDARRRDAQRRRRSRASAKSHELRRELAVASSPRSRKGCSMRCPSYLFSIPSVFFLSLLYSILFASIIFQLKIMREVWLDNYLGILFMISFSDVLYPYVQTFQ